MMAALRDFDGKTHGFDGYDMSVGGFVPADGIPFAKPLRVRPGAVRCAGRSGFASVSRDNLKTFPFPFPTSIQIDSAAAGGSEITAKLRLKPAASTYPSASRLAGTSR